MFGILALIVLGAGFIALIVGLAMSESFPDENYFDGQRPNPNKKPTRNFGIGAIILGVIMILGVSVAFVDEGEVLVPIQFGEALEPLGDPGVNLKSPFATLVVMPTRTVELTFKGGGTPSPETDEATFGQITTLSAEGAQVAVDLTVLYHIDPNMTAEVYRTVGKAWESVLVVPFTRNTTRDCIPEFNFEDARTSKRLAASSCIVNAMQTALAPRGVVVENVLLRDMRADAQLQAAIDAKLEAQSNAQRAEFIQREATVTAETKRIEAEGLANAVIEKAEGDAQAIRLRADAEAYANDVIALSLTPELLQLRIFEELGSKTVVITDGVSPLPLLPIDIP
jgi:regulator of protease activity HflC (stomatin/prohibitin superfamily)